MEIREAQYFLAVVAHGNFTKTSAALSMPTQTLSQVIRRLESSLEAQLFHRTGSVLELTPAGRAIVEPARMLLRAEVVARETFTELEQPLQGHVDVGAMPMLSASLLPEIMRKFRTSCPDASVNIIEFDTEEEIARATSSGQVELGIMNMEAHLDSPQVGRRLCAHAIEYDEFFLVVNSSAAESLPEQLDWDHLPELPTIGVSVGSNSRTAVDNAIRQSRSTTRHGVTTAHRQMPMKLVASGVGMYWATQRMIDTELELSIVPIRVNPPVALTSVLVHRPAVHSPTARAFAMTVLQSSPEKVNESHADAPPGCSLKHR